MIWELLDLERGEALLFTFLVIFNYLMQFAHAIWIYFSIQWYLWEQVPTSHSVQYVFLILTLFNSQVRFLVFAEHEQENFCNYIT